MSTDDPDDDSGDDYDTGDEEEPTIACPYCRRQIHEESIRCPHCENYLSAEEPTTGGKPWWIIIGALLCLYVVYRWIVG